ncbi:MAG: ferredoxin [Gemmatimonadales bacterium]
MTDGLRERRVGGITIRIDRTLCVGFGDCVEGAPRAFKLEDDDVVAFTEPESEDEQTLILACESCPVDALAVLDSKGNQIIP